VLCPSCAERNPDRARFCLRCGTPLGGPARRDEERKVVTVLFCDLVGFTARSDRADPEDVKATLRPYHAAIKRVLEGIGGTLDKFVGDGVLGVFGAPTSHEDDPERAIGAAFRIQQEIAALNDGSAGAPLTVRIGIATGEAVVAVGPGPQIGERVTGEVVTLAARLQAMAPPGGIAVGEATRWAIRDRFRFEEMEPAPDGLAAWRPVEVSRLVREHPDTPFVGRSEESALLRATFRRCATEPSVQLVTVTGEPGVGKTRLIMEFAEFLDAQPELIRWRLGRCLPYGDATGLAPLSDIVKAEIGLLETDAPEEALAKLSRSVEGAVRDPSEREWLLARLAPVAGVGEMSAAVDRTESFTAWRRYVEALASRHTLVLVFEDLHWADSVLIEFIAHLVDWSTDLPVLILCAGRPELYDRWPEWGGGTRNSATVALPTLSESETAMLISGLLDQAVLPTETQRTLLDRAGGNPLYAEEFVRMLTDQGILERSGRMLQLAGDAEIPVPDSIQAILGARLDALGYETKELLQDASVMGRTFWGGAISAIGGRAREDVRALLHEAARLELIRPIRSSSVQGDDEYAFWHVLVRDVAYGQLPRAERGAKHRAAAEWIAGVAGDRVGDRAELLAYHYGEALDLARATGAEDAEELRDLTVRFLLTAGDRAARVDAGSAERHFRRAADLLPETAPDRPRVLLRLADTETTLGRFAGARASFDDAIAGLRAKRDMVGVGEALALKTRALNKLGQLRESDALLQEAIGILEREPEGPELARAYSRMAGHQLLLGRFDECRDYADRTLKLAEDLGLDDEIVRARQNRGAARSELGDPGGLADLWAALRQALQIGIGVETAVTYGNLAYQLWLLDGPAIALQVWDSAVEFSEVRGFSTEAHWSRCGQLEVLFDLGRWDQLLAIADEIEAWDREEGGGQMRTFAEFYRAWVLVHRSEDRAPVLLAEEFLPRVRILRRAEFLAPALTVGALVEQLRGHEAMALDLVEEFVRETEDHVAYRVQYLPAAARVLVAAGRADRLEELLRDEPQTRNVRTRHALATARAVLAEARGDHADAAERHAACAAAWLSYGSVLERAHALAGEGRSRLALGDPDGAGEALRGARLAYAQLGAAPWVRKVDRLLGERGLAPHQPAG
jgi:class 3 adenylate cyclase/tetratricopeptide (TPR) repeat protein